MLYRYKFTKIYRLLLHFLRDEYHEWIAECLMRYHDSDFIFEIIFTLHS